MLNRAESAIGDGPFRIAASFSQTAGIACHQPVDTTSRGLLLAKGFTPDRLRVHSGILAGLYLSYRSGLDLLHFPQPLLARFT